MANINNGTLLNMSVYGHLAIMVIHNMINMKWQYYYLKIDGSAFFETKWYITEYHYHDYLSVYIICLLNAWNSTFPAISKAIHNIFGINFQNDCQFVYLKDNI